MARSVEEWVGATDDTQVPPRVRLRVFLKFNGICQECGLKIQGSNWICDHRLAIINGGQNRESNLGPVCYRCDKTKKTPADVKAKSETYRKRASYLGVKRKSRPIPGSRASGWKRKVDGTWEKR